MSLLERQFAFRAEIAAGDDAAPPSSRGMDIYRNAYRGRLLGALEVSFERTRRWIGEDTFQAVARHHVLTCPPTGWSLDDYGSEFPALLAGLFGNDPEVAELAWLEWHLQRAFAAADAPELDPTELGARGYSAEEWAAMRFTMATGFAAAPVATDVIELWEALAEERSGACTVTGHADAALLVWRSRLSPRYRLAWIDELHALEALAGGASLGALAEHHDAARLGEWLSQWLGEGIFSRGSPDHAGGEVT